MKDRIWKTAGEKDIEDLKADYTDAVVKRVNYVAEMPKCWMLDKVASKAYDFGKMTGKLEAKFEELVRLIGVEAAQKVHSQASWKCDDDDDDEEEDDD